jgi:hypothetical protein
MESFLTGIDCWGMIDATWHESIPAAAIQLSKLHWR